MSEQQTTTVHITASQAWWHIDWKGISHYQDLLWLMVRRDFVSKYKQTVLGPLWMIIQPLATTLVFTLIFSRVAQISTDGAPAPLFYLSGLVGWNLFSGVLGGSGNVLQANAGLFGKVYFPRLIVPLANTVSSLIPFAIQLLTFFGMMAFYGGGLVGHPDGAGLLVRLVLFPFCLAQIMAAGLGCGLIFSAMTAVYRDLQHMLGFVMQIWMYLTPVIYPLSQFPERWRWVPALNPISAPVEGLRLALLGTGSVTMVSFIISTLTSLALLVAGLAAFNHAEKDYIDRA